MTNVEMWWWSFQIKNLCFQFFSFPLKDTRRHAISYEPFSHPTVINKVLRRKGERGQIPSFCNLVWQILNYWGGGSLVHFGGLNTALWEAASIRPQIKTLIRTLSRCTREAYQLPMVTCRLCKSTVFREN